MNLTQSDTVIELQIQKYLKHAGINVPGSTFRIDDFGDSVRYSFQLDVPYMVRVPHKESMLSLFDQRFQKLYDDIKASPLVQGLVSDLEHKLKMANAASDELLQRIKELEKYKTHYELEMKLRHGIPDKSS